MGKIAQEFLDAADDLPDTQSQVGRITKNIAYAYAAKAILYQAYQQDDNNQVVAIDKQLLAEVVTLCDKVGAQGKTYDLLNDFQKLDQLEYENGVESVFAVQYSMDDETDGAGNINWSNLLNAPKGPYGGDGFFLPSQNLINAYKTDTYGLPLFDTFNTDDYGIYEGSELTNVDATVDPRLDFVTGRPGITWKHILPSLVKQIGCVTVANMVSTVPNASIFLRRVTRCSKVGLGGLPISIGRLSVMPTCCCGRLKR